MLLVARSRASWVHLHRCIKQVLVDTPCRSVVYASVNHISIRFDVIRVEEVDATRNYSYSCFTQMRNNARNAGFFSQISKLTTDG